MINRYKIKAIDKIFSDQNKYNNWLKIELLVLEYYSKINKISDNEYQILKNNLKVDINKINEIELAVKHDVIAFIESLNLCVESEAKKWIHYGLTSTDIVDTANAMAFLEVNKIIFDSLNDLMKTIKNLAYQHKLTYQMGRTHGIHAEITTFGLKLALWYDELNRIKKRFLFAANEIQTGKISGAVGTFANTGIELQEYVCSKLHLNSANISTQIIQRDIHAHYFSVLNQIGLSINKFSTELRHYSRTEVNEVNEFFDKNQKGSSAMPHKKNPITLENICGLSRLLNGYSLTINENVNLWHERDISHSSNERVIFLDATTIVVNIINKFNNVLTNLVVNQDQMEHNINLTYRTCFSQTLLLKLIDKTNFDTRKEVYELVQKLAFDSYNNKVDFETTLLNSEIKNYLSVDEIKEIFNKDYHLKYVDQIFKRVFENGK